MRFLICFLLSSSVAPVFCQHEFTGNAGDQIWENSQNWKLGASDPAPSFPEQGAAALITTGLGSVKLGKDTVLSNLDLQGTQTFTIDLNGNSLAISGNLSESGATHVIKNGDLALTRLRIDDLTLDGVSISPNDSIISGAGLILNGTSTLTNLGTFLINSTGGITGNSFGGITNNGTFEKSGNGLATISKPFTQNGGSTIVRSGGAELLFQNSVNIQAGDLRAEGFMIFNGPATLNNTSIALSDFGTMLFSDALTVNGTLTSTFTGEGSGKIVVDNALNGGTFNTAVNGPLIVNGTSQSENTTVTNRGRMIFSGGTLRNVINEQSGDFSVEKTGLTPRDILMDGNFTNRGQMTVKTDFVLAENGLLENASGGTLALMGGEVTTEALGNNARFTNAGTISLTAPPEDGLPVSSLNLATSSSGVINIDRGSLSLGSELELGGEICLKEGLSGETNQLSIGSFLIPKVTLNSTQFGFKEGEGEAEVLFKNGDYSLDGILTSLGVGAEVNLERGTWSTKGSGAFDFGPESPVIVGTNTFTPVFDLSKSISNVGSMKIKRLQIKGASPFVNSGEMEVTGPLRIGESASGAPGSFENISGSVTAINAPILLTPGSTFLNKASDTGDGGLSLTGTSGITLNSSPIAGSSPALLVNENLLLISGLPGKTIGTEFEQKAGDDALIVVEDASAGLTFFDKSRIRGGSVHLGKNVTFNDEVEWGEDGEVEILFTNPLLFPELKFNGTDKMVTLHSDLSTEGSGAVVLEKGTMVSAGGELKAVESAPFRQNGGTLGGGEETLVNQGSFLQRGGELVGSFENFGKLDASNGLISAEVSNQGEMKLAGVTLSGVLTNNAGSLLDEREGALELSGGTLLSPGSIVNEARMEVTGGIFRCRDQSSIEVEGGRLTMVDSSTLSGLDQSSLSITLGGELISERRNSTSAVQSLIDFTNLTLTDSSVSTDGAGLSLVGDQYSVSEVEMMIEPSLTIELRGTAQSGTAQLASLVVKKDGQARFLTSGATPAEVSISKVETQGRITGVLRQTGLLTTGENEERDIVIDGGLIQEGSAVTMLNSVAVGMGGSRVTKLRVSGNASLNGMLKAVFLGLSAGESVELIRATSITGTFSSVDLQSAKLGVELAVSYTPTSVVVTAVQSPGERYEDWAETQFTEEELLDDTISGPVADPDNDGADNWREYLVGTLPKDENSQPPSALVRRVVVEAPDESGERYLRIDTIIREGLAGVDVELTSSEDLSTIDLGKIETAYTLGSPDHPQEVSVRCVDPIESEGSASEFFSLRFSRSF